MLMPEMAPHLMTVRHRLLPGRHSRRLNGRSRLAGHDRYLDLGTPDDHFLFRVGDDGGVKLAGQGSRVLHARVADVDHLALEVHHQGTAVMRLPRVTLD